MFWLLVVRSYSVNISLHETEFQALLLDVLVFRKLKTKTSNIKSSSDTTLLALGENFECFDWSLTMVLNSFWQTNM